MSEWIMEYKRGKWMEFNCGQKIPQYPGLWCDGILFFMESL